MKKYVLLLSFLINPLCLTLPQLPPHIKQLFERFHNNRDDIALKYQLGNTLLNLGNTRFQENNLLEALDIYQELAQMFPSSSSIYHNLGYTLAELNRPEEAIKAYHHALLGDPENIETHFCLATAYLATHDYLNGFAEYEWRWKKQNNLMNNINIPIWHGENLEGKTILLRSEGSLGDVLQFVRFAQQLKDGCTRVVVQTFRCLVPLLLLCPYIDQIICHDEQIPLVDYQQSLMSLPYILGITYETVPNTPYLFANQTLVQTWKQRISKTTFNIGICWQADPGNDANRPVLARRSVPLHFFEQLAQVPGVKIYSLQARDGLSELHDNSWLHTFDDLDTMHGSFMDTAALIMHLDLIISVDTSVAHLAAGLGRPTWLLLPYKSDWRWGWQSDRSSWYPTMHIFRLPLINSWEYVLENINNKLILNRGRL